MTRRALLLLAAIAGCRGAAPSALPVGTEGDVAPVSTTEATPHDPPMQVASGFWRSSGHTVGLGVSPGWSGSASGADPEVLALRHDASGTRFELWLGSEAPTAACDEPSFSSAPGQTRAVPSLHSATTYTCQPTTAKGDAATVWVGELGPHYARVTLRWTAGDGVRAGQAASALLNSLECLTDCGYDAEAARGSAPQ